jgi:hypothetical protein
VLTAGLPCGLSAPAPALARRALVQPRATTEASGAAAVRCGAVRSCRDHQSPAGFLQRAAPPPPILGLRVPRPPMCPVCLLPLHRAAVGPGPSLCWLTACDSLGRVGREGARGRDWGGSLQ